MANEGPKSQTILVVGGGISGVTAAVEAAEVGYDVVLLERGPVIGGRVAQLNRYFPKLCHPTCGLEINFQRIRKNRRLKFFTMASVVGVEGRTGDYKVTVKTTPRHVNANCTACGACAEATELEVPDPFNFGLSKVKAAYLPHEHAYPMRYVIAPEALGTPEADKIKAACKYGAVDLEETEQTFDITAGAVIWATGWKPYDPAKIDSYNYVHSPDIVTNMEMERLASHAGPTGGKIVRPSNGEPAKRVALIQCAGSRDHNHLPYCSRICCLGSLKHAAYLREQYEDAEVDIYYIDIRAHDKLEAFYQKVAADPQVHFIKSKPGSVVVGEDGRPTVCGENTITREIYRNPYDLVVLATGMQPNAAEDYRPPMSLEADDYGFVVPALEGDDGIIPAGVAAGPLDVSLSVQSATAAALKAIQAVGGKAGAQQG
jgi:quinone-modifying oxidoreductase subunit QmoA